MSNETRHDLAGVYVPLRLTYGLIPSPTALRGLWQHLPYFHDGSADTLSDVVEHYDRHFELQLTDDEKLALIEFLKSLSQSTSWTSGAGPACGRERSPDAPSRGVAIRRKGYRRYRQPRSHHLGSPGSLSRRPASENAAGNTR